MTLSSPHLLEGARVEPDAQHAALVLGVFLQGLVVAGTWSMGLSWHGLTHSAALAVGTVALLPLIALGLRVPPLVVAVPVVSLLASAGLYQAHTAYVAATACSDAQLAAVATIAPPLGDRHDFRGGAETGCVAFYSTTQRPEWILGYYREQLLQGDWRLVGAENPDSVVAEKDGIVVQVTDTGGLVDVAVRGS